MNAHALTPSGLMAKAETARVSARVLLELGDLDGAANRAYYAMFDAARAALLASRAPVDADIGRTHSGLIAAFGKYLVKNGPVPKDLGRLLNRAHEVRQAADYNGTSVEHSDAMEIVARAGVFIETLRALIPNDNPDPLRR